MNKRLAILICASTGFFYDAHALPEVIDNSAYPAGSAPITNVNLPASPATGTLIELTGRLEQLQAEVQQLTGKVEEQANQIAELKKRQSSMYNDLDERIQGVENKATNNDQPDTTGNTDTSNPSETVAEPSGAPIDAEPTAQQPQPENRKEPEPSPEAQPAPAAKPNPTQASGPEKQEYDHAYLSLRTGHTAESIAEFSAYLEKYPTGGLANNAQYWLGEAHRANHDNSAAQKAFNDVIEKYPYGAKVPDALLKLGYIAMDEKNPDKAKEYFNRIINDHPNSQPAVLAAKKLQQLNISN